MKKNTIIIASIFFIILTAVSVGFFLVNKKTTVKSEPKTENVLNVNEGIVPTVDGSVKVSLDYTAGKKAVILSLTGIPKETNMVDYELSYEEKEKGLQGAIGTISLRGENSYEKEITLGTCSSGKCVYHEVVGSVKLILKFSGSYGEKIFEKEYAI